MQFFFRTKKHSDFAAVSVEHIRDAAHHSDLGWQSLAKSQSLTSLILIFFVECGDITHQQGKTFNHFLDSWKNTVAMVIPKFMNMFTGAWTTNRVAGFYGILMPLHVPEPSIVPYASGTCSFCHSNNKVTKSCHHAGFRISDLTWFQTFRGVWSSQTQKIYAIRRGELDEKKPRIPCGCATIVHLMYFSVNDFLETSPHMVSKGFCLGNKFQAMTFWAQKAPNQLNYLLVN